MALIWLPSFLDQLEMTLRAVHFELVEKVGWE